MPSVQRVTGSSDCGDKLEGSLDEIQHIKLRDAPGSYAASLENIVQDCCVCALHNRMRTQVHQRILVNLKIWSRGSRDGYRGRSMVHTDGGYGYGSFAVHVPVAMLLHNPTIPTDRILRADTAIHGRSAAELKS